MENIYHVQNEVQTYYRHISNVPNTFKVDSDLLFGMHEEKFLESFRYFTDLVKQMYMDMEKRPDQYGLLLYDINKENKKKEEGNLAKASWRSVKRLGDVIGNLGRLGEIEGDSLKIPLAPLKKELAKIQKSYLLINRLIDFGFAFTNYEEDKFVKGAEDSSLSYMKYPQLVKVIKAYSVSKPFNDNDPHEFYYFDYKRVADRSKLSEDCVTKDFAALLDSDKEKLLNNINKVFTKDFGFLPHYKDESIEYYLKKKRVARFMVDFHDMNAYLILKIKNMDKYIDYIDKLPAKLRKVFEKGNCSYCGFQNSTREFCKFRISWTLDGKRHDTCNFFSFRFKNPESDYSEYYTSLIGSEYGLI